jgi:hypothetical protein
VKGHFARAQAYRSRAGTHWKQRNPGSVARVPLAARILLVSLGDMKTRNENFQIRSFTVGLLGAAALAAGLLLVRQQKEPETDRPSSVPAGETQPATISLDRIRALGY